MTKAATVTDDMREEVLRLRHCGQTWAEIGRQLNRSTHTVRCWVDEEFRLKCRARESLRKERYRKRKAEYRYEKPQPEPKPPPAPPPAAFVDEASILRLHRKHVALTAIATLLGLKYRDVIAVIDGARA